MFVLVHRSSHPFVSTGNPGDGHGKRPLERVSPVFWMRRPHRRRPVDAGEQEVDQGHKSFPPCSANGTVRLRARVGKYLRPTHDGSVGRTSYRRCSQPREEEPTGMDSLPRGIQYFPNDFTVASRVTNGVAVAGPDRARSGSRGFRRTGSRGPPPHPSVSSGTGRRWGEPPPVLAPKPFCILSSNMVRNADITYLLVTVLSISYEEHGI